MKVIKPIIEDKALSEVIFRIGSGRVYGLELLESYKFVDESYEKNKFEIFPDKTKILPKITQATLSRQITRLVDEGFLKSEEGYDKNKKYYSVNINRIIEEFLIYSVKYIKNLPVDTQWKDVNLVKSMKEDANELSNKRYIQKCQKNPLISYFFETLLFFICQDISEEKEPNLTIKEVYDFLLDKGIIANLPSELSDRNSVDDIFISMMNKNEQQNELDKRWKKFDHDKEYLFFKDFCDKYSLIFDRIVKRRFLYQSINNATSELYHYLNGRLFAKTTPK